MSPSEYIGKTLRSRTTMAFALSVLAQGEVRDGFLDCAGETVKSIRHLVSDIFLLLENPVGIPLEEIHEARELLAELQNRLHRIDGELHHFC